MRVLLLTPYSPLVFHDHAAQDLAQGLVRALKSRAELHVYSPSHGVGLGSKSFSVDGVTYHSDGYEQPARGAARLGKLPRTVREEWPSISTRRVLRLAHEIHPDIVHGEYVQTSAALLRLGPNFTRTITLHDLAMNVAFQRSASGDVARQAYRRHQDWMTVNLERKILRTVDHAFTLSSRDAKRATHLARDVSALRIGIDIPEQVWHLAAGPTLRLVFAGALWRDANQQSARHLAERVFPLIQAALPSAELRIVGASPPESVRGLAQAPGISVPGRVEDFDDEFRASSLVLAPSMVDAGVLLKALRSMACGAPTLLNNASASPLDNLVGGEHALIANSPREMADAAIDVLTHPLKASHLGKNARNYVAENFSWSGYADGMLAGFGRAAAARIARARSN